MGKEKKSLEITIPSSLDDITLGSYLKFVALTTGDAVLSEESQVELMLTLFCNIQLHHLKLLENKQVNHIVSKLLPVVEQINSNDSKLIRRFKIDGVEYGMIPNLDTISYGENKDISSFMGDHSTITSAMGVLFRPICSTSGDTYEIEKYDASDKYSEVMKKMPLSVFIGAQVFFWTLTRELLHHIPKYLQKKMGSEQYKELMQKVSINQTGDPMMKFSALLKGI
jgi:hypothetical protein